MADVARHRATIEAGGTQVAFVHMHPEAQAAEFFARYGVADLPRVSDPQQRLYRAFDLGTLPLRGAFSARLAARYVEAMAHGHWPALAGGSLRRLPGAFLIAGGRVVKAFRPGSPGGRTDLDDLATCPVTDA